METPQDQKQARHLGYEPSRSLVALIASSSGISPASQVELLAVLMSMSPDELEATADALDASAEAERNGETLVYNPIDHLSVTDMREIAGNRSRARTLLRRCRPKLSSRHAGHAGRTQTHRSRPGHRRTASTRAGPDDDPGSSEPPPAALHLERHPKYGLVSPALAAVLETVA